MRLIKYLPMCGVTPPIKAEKIAFNTCGGVTGAGSACYRATPITVTHHYHIIIIAIDSSHLASVNHKNEMTTIMVKVKRIGTGQ